MNKLSCNECKEMYDACDCRDKGCAFHYHLQSCLSEAGAKYRTQLAKTQYKLNLFKFFDFACWDSDVVVRCGKIQLK